MNTATATCDALYGLPTGSSPYEEAQNEARREMTTQAVIQKELESHAADVESVCATRRTRSTLADKIAKFNSDPVWRQRILAAKRARRTIWLSLMLGTIIFLADLFLASPHLADLLTGNVVTYIPSDWLDKVDGRIVIPNGVRFAVGILFSLVALGATVLVRFLSDTTSLRQARALVRPGDTTGWQEIGRKIWNRQFLKIGYALIMAVTFAGYAKLTQDKLNEVSDLANAPALDLNFEKLGLAVSNGILATDEAVATPEAVRHITSGTALGPIAVCSMLFLLHCLLLLVPSSDNTIDLALAKFNPHDAAENMVKFQAAEESSLRQIMRRIESYPSNDPIRARLQAISAPVSGAIEELERNPLPVAPPLPQAGSWHSASSEMPDGASSQSTPPTNESSSPPSNSREDISNDPDPQVFG